MDDPVEQITETIEERLTDEDVTQNPIYSGRHGGYGGRMAAERPADAEDPVGYFLQDMTYHGKTDRTRDAYERVLRAFESFLGDATQPHPAGRPAPGLHGIRPQPPW